MPKLPKQEQPATPNLGRIINDLAITVIYCKLKQRDLTVEEFIQISLLIYAIQLIVAGRQN
ncbi:MAG: hypothetical protein OHK0017_08160 [Patescibacteria group bacterium]